tara:strand:- start:892 stop:1017 length:126 start_codon:yes stop_codon:yes gene_type:complete
MILALTKIYSAMKELMKAIPEQQSKYTNDAKGMGFKGDLNR